VGDLLFAIGATFSGIIGGIILLFVAGARLTGSKIFSRVALTETQSRKEGYTSSFNKENLIGKRGIAHTVLRPGGKVMIDGQVYDAFSRGEYIEKGQEVEVMTLSEEDRVLSIDLKPHVELEITYTEPGIKGDTVSNTLKAAKIETGAEVRVPLFINQGDKIKIDTRTGDYVERVKK